ncbi:tetratricopeptide repeat protein [Gordonia zhaorongruii]|uniref:tetratricopeptide repeat protein n=1 Tax=Gordonia zhaorongruii TaxID=2597659 RepID=UPI00104383B6|nr:tetratricopeptide repeat protein [Gordonia zhaorongruii]
MSGAVDLSGLKARAEAQRSAPAPGAAPTEPAAGGTASGPVIDVSEANFEADVISRSQEQLVVVVLWAAWSEPSGEVVTSLETLAGQADGAWTLARVDVDASPRVAQAFGAKSVPMVIALTGGQPVSAFDGVQPPEQISVWLKDIAAKVGITLPEGDPSAAADAEEPEDPRMTAAEELMNSGDLEGALTAYQAIVAVEPGNTEAASVARNIEFLMRAQEHDPTIIETAAAGDVDQQLAAADVLLLGQRPEQAFDRIIEVIRVSDGDEKSRARTRLLELFELFDPAEPFVVAARRKLATALY